MPNGVATEWAYNDDGQLTSVLSRRNGNVIDSNTYTPDPAGLIAQAVVNGVTWNYSYDDLYRLTQASVTGGSTYAWDYDLAGTCLSRSLGGVITDSYDYDRANRLIQVNGEPLAYDANGNLTAFGADRYTWNTRDEMVGLTRPGLSASFAYDAFGRRARKTINGVSTRYLYDGDEVVGDITDGDTIVYTANSPFLDEPIQRGLFYFTPNHLGSTTTLTAVTGSVVERYAYLPFGETFSSVAWPNAVQFTGRENDGTGLMYYRARYYAPEWGRFVSEDPIGLAGGLNLYGYVENDPVNLIDPTGTDSEQKLRALLEIFSHAFGAATGRVGMYGPVLSGSRVPTELPARSPQKALPAPPPQKALPAPKATPALGPHVHGNSSRSPRAGHVYRVDSPSGLHKVGESGAGELNGQSLRAEAQARRLTRQTGQPYRTRIIKRFKSKAEARAYERELIRRYVRRYGRRPPGNPLDR